MIIDEVVVDYCTVRLFAASVVAVQVSDTTKAVERFYVGYQKNYLGPVQA